jgi:hypothetical protein
VLAAAVVILSAVFSVTDFELLLLVTSLVTVTAEEIVIVAYKADVTAVSSAL